MAYPISDVPRRIVYSGSAGVGPYAFTFEVLTSTDIAVYKNSTLLTLTTDYTVSINSGTGTGNVTLVVAATGADTVTIVGDRAIQRSSDFVTGGDLFAQTLNDELDSLTIYAQQVDEKADRSIRAPVTDPTTINMVLPSASSRANTVLGFNSVGNPIVQPLNTTGVEESAVIRTSITGSAILPSGTEAERDGAPAAGYIRFNTDFDNFEGYNGSSWTSVGGGATGGGSDSIFIENGQTVTTNYSIPSAKNAMSTGPITVNAGITVTVPPGSRWVVL
jgi:hypothetical protein